MKLLASDFDNTLLFDGLFKDEDIQAINTFQKHQHLFGVCTGRGLGGVLRPTEPYDLHYDFYILMSGALILNKDKEIIFEKMISLPLVKEIFHFLNEQDASVIYKNHMYKVYKTEKIDFGGSYIDSFDQLNTDEVSSFSFHYPPSQIEKASRDTELLKEHFGHRIEIYQNKRHIDFAPIGCSKGKGIKIIQKYFDLNNDDVHGIGDSWNDLPMLMNVQHGYTFPYAPIDVQKYAEKIVDSVAACIQYIENS